MGVFRAYWGLPSKEFPYETKKAIFLSPLGAVWFFEGLQLLSFAFDTPPENFLEIIYKAFVILGIGYSIGVIALFLFIRPLCHFFIQKQGNVLGRLILASALISPIFTFVFFRGLINIFDLLSFEILKGSRLSVFLNEFEWWVYPFKPEGFDVSPYEFNYFGLGISMICVVSIAIIFWKFLKLKKSNSDLEINNA